MGSPVELASLVGRRRHRDVMVESLHCYLRGNENVYSRGS